MSARTVRARRDPRLLARVLRRVPMRYRAGADARLDRPAHVRAASGLAWVDARLAVVQDDASFVALVDPATGEADAVALPAGPGGLRQFDDARGNKADKLDLEALATVPGPDGPLLVAVGSGSARRREVVAVLSVRADATTVAVHAAPRLFGGLWDAPEFAGSDLNVEGALYVDGRLRLFGRGNGAARGELRPVDATCDLDCARLLAHVARPDEVAPPLPTDVTRYDLGLLGGVRLGFTDAALATAGGAARVLFTAAAEASPDATRDGDVAGSAVGVLDGEGDARWAEFVHADGRPFVAKVEGIAVAPDDPRRAWVAVDHDEHDRPSELCEVELDGPWL